MNKFASQIALLIAGSCITTSLILTISRALGLHLWVDELLSLWVTEPRNFYEMLSRAYSGVDGQFPLFYILTWALSFSIDPTAIRLVYVSIAYISLGVLGLYLSKHTPWQSVLLSLTVTLAFTPILESPLGDIRSYSLLLFGFTLALISSALLCKQYNYYNICLNTIAQCILIQSHVFGIIYAFALGLGIWIYFAIHLKNYTPIGVFCSFILPLLSFIPLLPVIFASRELISPVHWAGTVAPSAILHYLTFILPVTGWIVVLIMLLISSFSARREQQRDPILLLCIPCIGVIILLLVVSIWQPLIITRYLVIILILQIVVFSYLLGRNTANTFTMGLMALTIVTGLGYNIAWNITGRWTHTEILNNHISGTYDYTFPKNSVIISDDLNFYLPRNFYNHDDLKYFFVGSIEKAKLDNQHMVNEKIAFKLEEQGYNIKIKSAEEIIDYITENNISSVIILQRGPLRRDLQVVFEYLITHQFSASNIELGKLLIKQ